MNELNDFLNEAKYNPLKKMTMALNKILNIDWSDVDSSNESINAALVILEKMKSQLEFMKG